MMKWTKPGLTLRFKTPQFVAEEIEARFVWDLPWPQDGVLYWPAARKQVRLIGAVLPPVPEWAPPGTPVKVGATDACTP